MKLYIFSYATLTTLLLLSSWSRVKELVRAIFPSIYLIYFTGKRFTSTLTIKGIDTTVDTRDYKCKVTMPVDATLTEESNTATFYRLGLYHHTCLL